MLGLEEQSQTPHILFEASIVSINMKRYGGSFVQALGVALSHADMWNTTKIKLTWPELWEEYLNFEKTKDSSNDR